MTATAPAASPARARRILLLIVVMFMLPPLIAMGLYLTGWRPEAGETRNFGELLPAPIDLQALSPRQADGEAFAWVPQERNWHVVIEAPANCGEPCARMLDTLHRVWQTEGRHADRMFVLWAGELPEGPRWRTLVPLGDNPELLAALPERSAPDALPVYLIDGRGFLVMRYAPGFDPSGLRKDLARLLK